MAILALFALFEFNIIKKILKNLKKCDFCQISPATTTHNSTKKI
jgi:hypothetical protein